MKQIQIGVQLYTLRDECNVDMRGTLRRLKELGYQGVELSGYGDLTIEELRSELESLKLAVISMHCGIDSLEGELEKVIKENKFLGNKYVVCSYLEEDRRTEEGYLKTIESLKVASEKLAAEGITLLYHNHDFEFETTLGTQIAMEAILANANVDAEFDVYWLKFAGENPVEWLNRYSGRLPLVHLKDMTVDGTRTFAELGTGGVDIEAVLNVAEKVGIEWFIVEQDVCQTSPLECVETSINYLKIKLQ